MTKGKLLVIIVLFSIQHSFSQDKDWNFYDLDSIVSVEMPFVVYEIDSITENTKVYEMYSEDKSSKYLAQKLSLKNEYAKSIKNILPKNSKSLKNFYLDFVDILNVDDGFYLEYGGSIENNSLLGYRFFHKSDVGKTLYESHIFYINENLYLFSYFNENGLNENYRKKFFDSIVFVSDSDLRQYPLKKMSSIKKIAFGLMIVLIISFIIRVNSKRRKTL